MEKQVKVKPRIGVKILFIFILICFLLFIYARYINTSGFVTHEVAVIDEALPQDYNGFKVVHFSDLHYGRTTFEENLKKIVEEINYLSPDVIVFTGDLFDSDSIPDEDIKIVTKYLEQLEARLYKFAVIADYDQKYLDCKEDDPVLEVEQVAFLSDMRPFEFSQTRHRYDKGEFYVNNLI